MRIAITGAGGFIGSKVLEKLADYDEIDILALSRVQNDRTLYNKVRWVKTDYSVDSLNKVLKNVDVIIHLAAGNEFERENRTVIYTYSRSSQYAV